MAPSAIVEAVPQAQRNGSHSREGHSDSTKSAMEFDRHQAFNSPLQPGRPRAFERTSSAETHDLVCVGFGPASLAIAVALYDRAETAQLNGSDGSLPRVVFLEKQKSFGWHAGMLLPGAKMQISFVKDLATLRNPRSKFTFLNYLKENDRLVQFTNLDTFLPLRLEFEDYLKWSARHFSDMVAYSQDVMSVRPLKSRTDGKYDHLVITARNSTTGEVQHIVGRNVVIAAGGRPAKPAVFPEKSDRVIHSSEYKHRIASLLPDSGKAYSIAVVGSGQSAAEVFNDLHARYPNASTSLLFRDSTLRPSDDSPFVNEVFNPEAVDEFYARPAELRSAQLRSYKATNYSVVRLNLLEKIYEDLYYQRIKQTDPTKWQHRLLPQREIIDVIDVPDTKQVQLVLHNQDPNTRVSTESLNVDAVVLATGYTRNVHLTMLKDCEAINGSSDGKWRAERDYQVRLNRDMVEEGVSIYLQGCNEETHGLSDTLLSILATRGGELVQSIFGDS